MTNGPNQSIHEYTWAWLSPMGLRFWSKPKELWDMLTWPDRPLGALPPQLMWLPMLSLMIGFLQNVEFECELPSPLDMKELGNSFSPSMIYIYIYIFDSHNGEGGIWTLEVSIRNIRRCQLSYKALGSPSMIWIGENSGKNICIWSRLVHWRSIARFCCFCCLFSLSKLSIYREKINKKRRAKWRKKEGKNFSTWG